MRNFRTAAAALAAAGVAALGVVTATGGVAQVATNLSITGCSINVALLGRQVYPTCAAPEGTIYNPTEITATVDPSYLQAFLGQLGLGVKVSYDLVCSVDGNRVAVRPRASGRGRAVPR